MRYFILLALVACTTAFLFPSSGGGGGGCGGGCGGGGGGCGGGCGGGGGSDTSCFPKLSCKKICFSVPSLSLPSPCGGGGGGGCGGGCGRKKREVTGDNTCTDPELKIIITEAIGDNTQESRDTIVEALKENYPQDKYLVSCVEGEHEFATSADSYCSDGNEEQTCFVVKSSDKQ